MMMSNPPPKRTGPRPKSIVLKNGVQPRVYQTFEDWQALQARDMRTPRERGIDIGSSVMWRHRANGIIATDRATVLAVAENTLTIQVKDIETRTCDVNIHEIVSNDDDRAKIREPFRRPGQ
jgi:hypothetical protein